MAGSIKLQQGSIRSLVVSRSSRFPEYRPQTQQQSGALLYQQGALSDQQSQLNNGVHSLGREVSEPQRHQQHTRQSSEEESQLVRERHVSIRLQMSIMASDGQISDPPRNVATPNASLGMGDRGFRRLTPNRDVSMDRRGPLAGMGSAQRGTRVKIRHGECYDQRRSEIPRRSLPSMARFGSHLDRGTRLLYRGRTRCRNSSGK